jgi:hypothetical protein
MHKQNSGLSLLRKKPLLMSNAKHASLFMRQKNKKAAGPATGQVATCT